MTLISLAGRPTGPALTEVRPSFTIPADVPQAALLAHARRTADLHRACAVALSATPPYERARERWVDVAALGIGFSWAVDLGAFEDGDRRYSLRAIREAVWPADHSPAARAKEALSLDAPRFDPACGYVSDRACPLSGPRGGRCVRRDRKLTRWVTDPETGAWEYREVCPLHWDQVQRRLIDAPEPPPNRGGVLLAVFPEVEVEALYQWARPQWCAPTLPMPTERPRLRLLTGEPS